MLDGIPKSKWMQQYGLGWTENFNLTDVCQMQELPQNIPYVPHAPLTNGVFLQQNQFLPKIYGSMQISAADHCHLFLSNWSKRSDSSSSSKSENVNDNYDVNGWRGWGRRYGTTFNLYFFSYAWTSLSTVCFPKLQQIDFPLSWQRPFWIFQYFTIRLFLLLHTFFFQTTRLEIDLCPGVPIRVNEGV